MSVNLNELQAHRARLLQELAAIEEAIACFADATPVRIETHKNLRNSKGVTWLTEESNRYMLVFADEALTIPVDKSSHDGWVSKSALAEFKLQNADWQEILKVLE